MKKILYSMVIVAAAAAVVIGGTTAFFSDTEESTGNTFTAGAIDLLVDSDAHYAGLVCAKDQAGAYIWQLEDPQVQTTRPDLLDVSCNGTWEETDLGPTNTFFAYKDLKPGDSGENTISLHVKNNDAYMCAIIDNMVDSDNDCTEPEKEDGDLTCDDPGEGQGELSQEIRFFAWEDNDDTDDSIPCDNKWNGAESEKILFSNEEGPASDVIDGKIYPMYVPGSPLKGDTTSCIGLYWCYGDILVNPDGVLTCNGKEVDNLTQTDSLSADIGFYVEQARNNDNFTCPEPRLPSATVEQNTTWSFVDLDSNGGGAGKEWFAKARNNNANFEVSVGITDGAGQQDTDEATWTANTDIPFTLTYDGAGNATFTAGGVTTNYAVGAGSFGRIGINAKAPNGQTTVVDNLSLSTVAPLGTDSVTSTGAGANDVESLTLSSPTINGSWVLTGTYNFSAVGAPYPQEYPAMQISID